LCGPHECRTGLASLGSRPGAEIQNDSQNTEYLDRVASLRKESRASHVEAKECSHAFKGRIMSKGMPAMPTLPRDHSSFCTLCNADLKQSLTSCGSAQLALEPGSRAGPSSPGSPMQFWWREEPLKAEQNADSAHCLRKVKQCPSLGMEPPSRQESEASQLNVLRQSTVVGTSHHPGEVGSRSMENQNARLGQC
jgi:hypothetical protein